MQSMKKMHITLAQVRALVAVVEAGSFSDAALTLNMTQSALSHALAALEDTLRITLLERRRDGVRPTEAGQRVLLHARDVLTSLEGMHQEAAACQGMTMGKLRIGSFTSTSARLLPGLLSAYRRRYPGVEIVLFDGTDDEILGWFDTRVIDVGFVAQPAAGLTVVPLTNDPFFVLLPPGHALGLQPSVSLSQLAEEPFIMSTGGCEPLIRPLFSQVGLTPHVAYAVREVSTIVAMVQEGLGVSIVPALALPAQECPVMMLPLTPPAYRHLGLAVRSVDTVPPTVQALLELAQEQR